MVQAEDLIQVENTLWVLTMAMGLSVFDFDFPHHFNCRRPWHRPPKVTAIARAGAYADYEQRYRQLLAEGIVLIHSPEQNRTDRPANCRSGIRSLLI